MHDDRYLFEFLILEGAQAGLSWSTILRKRASYKKAFIVFDAKKIAKYDEAKIAALLQNPDIVRNRQKIYAAVKNVKAYLEVQQEFGSFDAFSWSLVEGKPKQNEWKNMGQIPAKTDISDAMSKTLNKRGFGFVGSMICYAFMQAVGMGMITQQIAFDTKRSVICNRLHEKIRSRVTYATASLKLSTP